MTVEPRRPARRPRSATQGGRCPNISKTARPIGFTSTKRRNSQAIDAALQFLADRKQQAGHAQYRADHKGTPFYVLGYAAFASHDYPSTSLYFDAAHRGFLPARDFETVSVVPSGHGSQAAPGNFVQLAMPCDEADH